MSDHYTFVTSIIFNDKEKANQIEEQLKKEEDIDDFYRHETPGGSTYFTGYFRNLGGGPWELLNAFTFNNDLNVVCICDDEIYSNVETDSPK